MIETTERQSNDNFNKLCTTLDTLTSSIADGFALLRQIHPPPQSVNMLPPQPYQPSGPYGHLYASAPAIHTAPGTYPPNSTAGTYLPNSTPATYPPNSRYSTYPPNSTITDSPHPATSPAQGSRQFSFTEALFGDDIE